MIEQNDVSNPDCKESLLKELEALPDDWRFTPVNGNKQPYSLRWNKRPKRRELIERHIKIGRCKAIGVLCGSKSEGQLFVDFDGTSSWGYFELMFGVNPHDLPITPAVTSGKKGRQQQIFHVPEKYWNEIKTTKLVTLCGIEKREGVEYLELRWDGCQSVVAGVHPETGSYRWLPGKSHREIAVAEAPIYLIEAMKRPVAPPKSTHLYTRNYNGDGDVALARECLAALSPWRAGSHDEWIHVGMALHSVGDDSLLDDWDRWSQQSDKYESGECERRWHSFNRSGLNIGSLCYWAKQDGWKSNKEFGKQVNKGVRKNMSESEAFKTALTEICKETDPELVALKKATVATTFKVSVQEINKLLKQKEQTEEARHVEDYVFNTDSLFKEELAEDFLVPGMLPRGGSVILAGDAKAGKTLLAYELAYAVATGGEFLGERVPQGRVLLFQIERPNKNLRRLIKRGFSSDLLKSSVRVLTKYSPELLEQELAADNYTLVIIDSLTAINVDSGVSEWSKEYADPIYKMQPHIEKANATCIIIHHLSKSNEAQGVRQLRGSSAIPGAVWGCLVLKHVLKQDPYNKKKFVIDPNETHRTLELVGLQDAGGAALDIELNIENNSWVNHGEVGVSKEVVEARRTMRERILNVMLHNYPHPLPGMEIKEMLELTTKEELDTMWKALGRMAERKEINAKPNPKKLSSRLYYLPHSYYLELSSNFNQSYTEKETQILDSTNDVQKVSNDTQKNADILSRNGNVDQVSVSVKLLDTVENMEGGGVPVPQKTPLAPQGTKPRCGDLIQYVGSGDLDGKGEDLLVKSFSGVNEGVDNDYRKPLKYIICLRPNGNEAKFISGNPYIPIEDTIIVKQQVRT
ncbi:AAA family ATPase [Scytonema millei]|uniref:AAA family ATPase n=1 Tax=Scytonema millei VB511283 TaxID=1245923 RepID=A0A9X5E407_9CYAN|nr:AAA family ATPase [Scytonema millei]NHC33784.1 AAA family ATPase [Scytonema millei VB511283]